VKASTITFYEFKLKKWFLSKGLLNNNFDYKKRRNEEVLENEKGSKNTTALLPSSEKYSRNEI